MIRRASVWLGVRSVFWVILLPGGVAGYLPWRYFGLGASALELRGPFAWVGIPVMAIGAALLAACIWEFAHRGRGTLSPADPPAELVVHGLYRFVRNPMYLSVGTILCGELLLLPSSGFVIYVLCWSLAAGLFVTGFEEPFLRRRFGESYRRYTESVRRWMPSFRAPSPSR